MSNDWNTEAAEEERGKGGADLNLLTEKIIGAAMKVHTALGPGLLESAYEACLAYELVNAGRVVERQKKLPLIYGDLHLEEGYRIDLLVDHRVVVELKSGRAAKGPPRGAATVVSSALGLLSWAAVEFQRQTPPDRNSARD